MSARQREPQTVVVKGEGVEVKIIKGKVAQFVYQDLVQQRFNEADKYCIVWTPVNITPTQCTQFTLEILTLWSVLN